ncbi:hypothetical protein [Desulfomicrobium salsuginis]
MAKDTQKKEDKKKKIEEIGIKLLKFAQENSSDKKEIDVSRAKKEFKCFRNVILEAYAFGPVELKEYKIIEGKSPSPLKEVEPPCLSGKGTITIKKYYVDEYNEKYSNNQIKRESPLDVAFEDGKIILSKK